MKKTMLLIFAILLIALLPDVFAIFQTGWSGNPDNASSAWFFCDGVRSDGFSCGSYFDNTSAWVAIEGGSGDNVQLNKNSMRITTVSDNTYNDGLSGKLKNRLPNDVSCDIEASMNLPGATNTDFVVSYLGNGKNFNWGTDGQVWIRERSTACSGGLELSISNAGTLSTCIKDNYKPSNNQKLNITMVLNASSKTFEVYLYNNDTYYTKSQAGGTWLDNLNFSASAFDGNSGTGGVLNVSYVACYNRTLGAPQALVVDTTPPTSDSTALNDTTPRINHHVNPSAKFTDETSLSSIWAAHNLSGTFANFSSTNFSGTVLTGNFSPNVTNTLSRGNVVGFRFTANDTSGNSVQSAISTYTVENTPPTNPTILYPTESLLITDGTIDLNITYPADADSDSLTAYFYINGTLNSTSTGNSTFNASDGKYNLTIALSDGIYLANTTLNSFKIDTITPTDNLSNSGLSGAFLNANTTRIISASDVNLYGHNVSIYSASGALVYSQEITNIATTTNSFLVHINTTYGDGNYTSFSNESDDHTAESIPDYQTTKDNAKKKLRFITDTSDVSLALINATGFENKGDGTKTKDLNLNFVQVDTVKMIDRYSMIFNYTKPESKYTYFEYILNLTSTKKMMPRNSDFVGHFITGDNWIDMAPSDYATWQKISDNNYIVTIGINSTNVKLQSIGGLNKGGTQISFAIDTISPTASSLRNSSVSGSQITTANSVNISIEIKDLYLKNITLSHNASGTLSHHSIPEGGNKTYHYIIGSGNLSSEQVVGWNATAYDRAGNILESSTSTFSIIQSLESASQPSTGGAGGAGGSGGALTRCDPLAQAWKTCYFYDQTIKACAKGCPSGYSCVKEELRCAESITISTSGTVIETPKGQSLLSSLWQKTKTFMASLFSNEVEGLEAIPLQTASSQTTPTTNPTGEESSSLISEDAPIQKVIAHPIMALVFIGIVGTVLALINFGPLLIAPPQVFFLIGYWAIVFILWKFKVFGG